MKIVNQGPGRKNWDHWVEERWHISEFVEIVYKFSPFDWQSLRSRYVPSLAKSEAESPLKSFHTLLSPMLQNFAFPRQTRNSDLSHPTITIMSLSVKVNPLATNAAEAVCKHALYCRA